MKVKISSERYSLVTNPKKIIQELNRKNIFKNIDSDLTKLYLLHLEKNYTYSELKIMRNTLINENNSKSSAQSIFVAVFGVLIVIITTVILASMDMDDISVLTVAVSILFIYMLMIIGYYFGTQIFHGRRNKIINHLNLLFEIAKKENIDK